MLLRNWLLLLTVVSSAAQIGCKREDDELSGKPKNKSGNLGPSIPAPTQGPVIQSVGTPTTPEPPETDSEDGESSEGFLPTTGPTQPEEADYSLSGVQYSLSKGYQDLGCQKFKAFSKRPMSFDIQHSPMPIVSEEGRFSKADLCAISGQFTLPANHIVNLSFFSMPVSTEMLLEEGDTHSVTYDFNYNVNGETFSKSYVGSSYGPYEGIRDVPLDVRRVSEMNCKNASDKERDVNFSIKLGGLVWPKANIDSTGKIVFGYVLISPTVDLTFTKCS